MTGFPRSPRVQKGAILGLDPFNPLASVVVFQYNPEQLRRTLTAQTAAADGDEREALRLKAPPKEQIEVTIEVDAADQLETGDALAQELGVHPTLASLEMLLYPKSAVVIANEVLKAVGVIEVLPPEAPLTLFIWGIKRVLPVRITSLNVTETHFDPNLNPIVAEVSLTMDVLTYHDLGLVSPGGALYMGHQIIKEVMASIH
ncbi:MAG: hypothetical protein R3362_01350, partial [Rhodothermales bacterium]|nr:hypothetical protein [Rhodothermales bacterium]